MLTTENTRAIAENIVTDLNANVTDPRPHRVPVLSPEAAILMDKAIIAKPLGIPQVCDIHIKNTEYRYRWVNKGGRNGAMYMQRRSQGFTNATTDDVRVLGGDVTSNNSEITAGDLVLMKIRKDLYDAAMKYNMEKAHVLQRTRGMYLKGASPDVNSDAQVTRETVAPSTAAFIPDEQAIEKAISQSMKSGAAEQARKAVDEIRQKHVASAEGASKE